MPVLSCCVLVVTVEVTTKEKAWRQKRDLIIRTTEGHSERQEAIKSNTDSPTKRRREALPAAGAVKANS